MSGNALDTATLAQLVSEITEEILRSRRPSAPGQAGTASSTVIPKAPSASRIAAAIDHTNLKPEATRNEILTLCAEARQHHFAAVCVQPIWVGDAERALRDTSVAVCTVIGFPSGAVPSPAKCAEAALAIRKGARELDMVIPIGLLRQGDFDAVQAEIQTLATVCHRSGVILKVILETSTLTDTEIAIGCALCRMAGADFVKTSTGFHPSGGAQEDHVRLMRHAVGDGIGVKAAGGIRSAQSALAMMAAGANRIGTSAGVRILEELAR